LKTLLTGATGFIGSHVARLLADRGEELRVAVRGELTDADPRRQALEGLDAERVRCDVLDRRAVRRALRGVDRVFHVAGMTSIRPRDAERVFEVNVRGTKTLLEECLRAEVKRVLYTSSAAALGPAPDGGTADETQLFRAGRLGIPYVNSVHEAEVEAFRLAARGLPLVCVNPTVVLGAGDVHVTSTRLVRNFLLGQVPVYADGAVNIVDVEDVAAGHLLADEKGTTGERYILGGRNFTFDRLFADLGRLSGVEPPLKLGSGMAKAAARVLEVAPGRSPINVQEVEAASLWWTYRSTKARRELGWRTRPHEDTLEATVAWHLDREGDRIARTRRSGQVQYRLAGAALGAVEGAGALAGRVWRRAAGARS
jgi:dihydroflavonol-4-reductase